MKARLNFPAAIRSFVGYLEGTEKAAHTIKNYKLDLLSFQKFLESELGPRPMRLDQITRKELELFHEYLKKQGLKTNTRRRKLLTVRHMIKFLTNRNKLALDVGRKMPTPHKVERVPFTVGTPELVAAIRKLPRVTLLDARNRVLLWTLAETGCLVSEVTTLRFDQWKGNATRAEVNIEGKSPRALQVSVELFQSVQELKRQTQSLGKNQDKPWLFLGFNKFGSLGSPISARGVELLVQAYAPKLKFPKIVPRTFRHSIVLHWFQQRVSPTEVQKRLGLRTAYAFRVYEPILQALREENQPKTRSKSGTTSNVEMNP